MGFRIVAVAVAMIAALVGPVVQTAVAAECVPEVWINDAATVVEGMGPLEFTVGIAADPGCSVNGSVRYRSVPTPSPSKFAATAGDDYIAKQGWLVWSAENPGTKIIVIPVVADYENEPIEKLSVCLDMASNVQIIDRCAVGAIDSTPWCAIPVSSPVSASNGNCSFEVGLAGEASRSVLVEFSTFDGTARAGEDFVGIRQGRLTIPAGERHGEFFVQILPDRVCEPDELFEVRLTAIVDGFTLSDRMIVTIRC